MAEQKVTGKVAVRTISRTFFAMPERIQKPVEPVPWGPKQGDGGGPRSAHRLANVVEVFFEVGDGKGTLLRFDYTNPPRPPKPNQLWHLGKIVFNKTYWHTVPKGRV